MSEFIFTHFMAAGFGHLFLSYVILNIVLTIVFKIIYDINDKMAAKFGFKKEALPNFGWYWLAFSWWGPLGSIIMIIPTFMTLIGVLIMVLDGLQYLWDSFLNLLFSFFKRLKD